MKQDHQTSFGRHISAVPLKSRTVVEDAALLDKWQLLSALTNAAADFGLTHRSLSVLRALISFHPDRMISTAPLSCVVFPANRTLSERLGGMPESTLRRHLATLVSAGIVSRHDSANRKRFARRYGAGDTRTAFGFDLSAMARLAPQIISASEAACERRLHIQALRAQVAAERQRLIETRGPCDLTDDIFKLLRRKPDEAALEEALQVLESMSHTEEASSTDAQNERHIQSEIKTYSEEITHHKKSDPTDTPCFDDLISHCSEYQCFFPDPVHNWQDLSRIAYAVCPMIGIDLPLYGRALAQMGAERAISSVLCILENLGRIDNPGGYLQRLIQRDRSGGVDFKQLLKMHYTLKAGNCQLTTDNIH